MVDNIFESIKSFLPHYLNPPKISALLNDLRSFPEGQNYFFEGPVSDWLQGDCWNGFVLINFDSGNRQEVSGVIISNSCDIDLKNDSMLPRYVLFSPLVSLAKILAFLCENEISEEKQRNFVDAVKKQRVFQIIYFPPKPGVVDESLIFLDQIYSQPLLHFKRNPKSKLFSLNDYGFYLFLLKLSIHFTRIDEKVSRS